MNFLWSTIFQDSLSLKIGEAMIKLVNFFVVLMCASIATASTVVWGTGGFVEYGDGSSLGLSGHANVRMWQWDINSELKPSIYFDQAQSGSAVIMSSIDLHLLAYAVYATEAAYGDVMDFDVFGGADVTWKSLTVNPGGTSYLGYLTKMYDMNIDEFRYVYGWVGFTVDDSGALAVTGAAVDLDGGPMVVGAGAIPEPSSALLLLVGLAGLGLRRGRSGCLVPGAGCLVLGANTVSFMGRNYRCGNGID